jgi:Rrf2 family protein
MAQSSSSMQLTRAADYAVRVTVHLATLPANERTVLPELARATGVPATFLSKVLQKLRDCGFVTSRRGQAGGFELLAAGRAATITQIIEAMDGPICLNLCLAHGESCNRKHFCPAHPVWIDAQKAMLGVLNNFTVTDLAIKAAMQNGANGRSR